MSDFNHNGKGHSEDEPNIDYDVLSDIDRQDGGTDGRCGSNKNYCQRIVGLIVVAVIILYKIMRLF